MYQLVFNQIKQEITSVKKVVGTEVSVVPFCEDNTDYQKYLAWVAEGNEPLPADD